VGKRDGASTAGQATVWRRRGGALAGLLAMAFLVASLAGCGTSATGGGSGKVRIVAGENFWGSVAAQVAGGHAEVTSIITSPDADPHDYEAKPTDARAVADAQYVIVNGAGYDPWLQKALDANPSAGRKALDIGKLVGRKAGDNPHLWYNPAFVMKVADQITADLKALDAADAAALDQQNATFKTVNLKTYNDLIQTIKSKYAGQSVGSTESIFVDMAAATGLNLTTPAGFMKAVSEGEDISPADKAAFEEQVTKKQIKVLVFNRQNATPDTDAIRQKAFAARIPVVNITETLDPATVSFQEWQDAQLQYLLQALEDANAA
jgi:zinc/manganese transport system substrate-binding protein